MTRLRWLAVLAAVALSPGTGLAAECAGLTITGHPEYAPISYGKDGRIVGAAADLAAAVAGELKLPLASQEMGSWADAQAAAREGKADMIFGIYYNDERAAYLDYVRPAFMLDPVVVMVARGKAFAYRTPADLIGRKGVTNAGESYGPEFDRFIVEKLDVERSDGVDAAFTDLLADKYDYMIVGLYPGLAEAAEIGVKDRLEALEPPIMAAEMFAAFSKKAPCLALIDKVSAAIKAITADGRYDKMLAEAAKRWESEHMKR